jgi:transcriptional regulator with XRE-family HTH domain
LSETPSGELSPSVANATEAGSVLRAARQAAGLSLAAMANRTNYSRGYLWNVEVGRRRATPELVYAYERALGDDVERRQLLMGLLAGAVAPSATTAAIAEAFEMALGEPTLSVDDWLEKLDTYGRDYMSLGAGELQARLSADLVRIRARLDDPVVCAAAARLLTVHGKTSPSAAADPRQPVSRTATPDDPPTGLGALRWYQLAARTADRSDDTDTRVWTRGRAALALAYEAEELPAARELATQALALDDRPSLGRLNALLGLAHVQGLEGDRDGALATYDDARRTFDLVGSDDGVSDFLIPEWRMATISSLLLARLGEEHLAIDAQEAADRARPDDLARFATHIELHRGLMMAKAGDKAAGVDYARRALAQLPTERHSLSLRLMMAEIEATPAA